MGMLSGKTWVLRWPALPVLTDFMNTLVAKAIAQAMGAVEGVTFLQTPWFAEARVEVVNANTFRGSVANMIQRGGSQLEQQKAMIVTVGIAGDTQHLGSVARDLGLSLAKGKTYAQIAKLIEGFARQYERGLLDVSSDWVVSVSDKVEIRPSSVKGKGYLLPSLVRSVSFYEGGRFSGFKDEKSSGSLSKGVFETRCDAAWWTLTLAAAGVSLTTVERAQRESKYVFVSFEPLYGIRYDSLNYYMEFSEAVERFIGQVGLFVEDEELFRLSLLFHVYSVLSSPSIPSRFGIKLRSIRAVGRRFTEAYLTSIFSSEVEALHRVLLGYVKAPRDAAEACSELGSFTMAIQRSAPAIARELNLDAFASKLKVLLRALSEPGYVPPGEPLYDLLRTMRVGEWRARFVGLLSSWIERRDGCSKTSAVKEAREKYDRVMELAAIVARSLR
ncbi:MAG: hypothetical protein QXU69_08635 [Thermofilaceae archaeon]